MHTTWISQSDMFLGCVETCIGINAGSNTIYKRENFTEYKEKYDFYSISYPNLISEMNTLKIKYFH